MRQMDILTELAPVLADFLPEFYRPNCCIAATRIVTYALTHLGVRAEPVVVRACFLSPGWRRFVAEHERYPNPSETVDDIWSVGLGVEPDPDDPDAQMPPDATAFVGHMVADVRIDDGARFIFDGSLGQAHRPDKGIPLPCVGLFGIDPDPAHFAADGDHFTVVDPDSDVLISYQRIPSPVDYTSAKDWSGLMIGFHSAALTDYVKRRLACRDTSGAA